MQGYFEYLRMTGKPLDATTNVTKIKLRGWYQSYSTRKEICIHIASKQSGLLSTNSTDQL